MANRIQQNINRIIGPEQVQFISYKVSLTFGKKISKSVNVSHIKSLLKSYLNNYRKKQQNTISTLHLKQK